jgi:hypothetical protein
MQLLADAGSSLANSSTLKMEAMRSSETSAHKLHGATTQKAAFFIVAAVKTSNLTINIFVRSCKINA